MYGIISVDPFPESSDLHRLQVHIQMTYVSGLNDHYSSHMVKRVKWFISNTHPFAEGIGF